MDFFTITSFYYCKLVISARLLRVTRFENEKLAKLSRETGQNWPQIGQKANEIFLEYFFFKLAKNWPKICFWSQTFSSGQHLLKLTNLSEIGQ